MTHGLRKHYYDGTRTYKSWTEMRSRCNCKTKDNYKYYGGKGIKICARWDDFLLFLEDMGERPDGMSLDRIESDGDYTPENCKWSTHTQQTRNRPSFNVRIQAYGRDLCVSEWANITGLLDKTIYRRVKQGDTGEYALRPLRYAK